METVLGVCAATGELLAPGTGDAPFAVARPFPVKGKVSSGCAADPPVTVATLPSIGDDDETPRGASGKYGVRP